MKFTERDVIWIKLYGKSAHYQRVTLLGWGGQLCAREGKVNEYI